MTFAFGDITVTTWCELDGLQLWRANDGEHVGYFTAERDAEEWLLHALGCAVLGLPLSENAADLLAEV